MRQSATGLVLVVCFAAFTGSVCHAQANSPRNAAPDQTLCSFLTKAEAESILGEPVVQQAASASLCRYLQNAYDGGTGPNNKQLSLAIAHSASPNPEGVNSRRASIAGDPGLVGVSVRDVTDFADAALWSWTTRWGRLNAFKGGTIEAQVTIAGIDEAPALKNAIKLAVRLLGESGKTGYTYAGWAGGSSKNGISVAALTAPPANAAAPAGASKTIRGTVSRVAVDFDRSPHWLSIFFKEYPESSFVVCSPDPEMFRETIADLYTLVGKTMEVTGQAEKSQCAYEHQADSIRVLDSQHYLVQVPPAGPRRTVTADSAPRLAEPRVGLDICNDGKVDFDAFARTGQAGVTAAHVVPGDCVHVYEGQQGTPAYVGLAFADSHGQWGAPRRLDLLPGDTGLGILPTKLWSRADERVSVKHGTGNVSMPMQLLFTPEVPVCRTQTSQSASLPFNATNAEISQASIYDSLHPPVTICDGFEHTLNVVAYAETHEVTFEKKCFACPHDSSITQADMRKGVEAASKISPFIGQFVQFASQVAAVGGEDERQLRESVDGPLESERMNWDGMNKALELVRPAQGRPPEMPQYLTIRGTISRVDVSPPGASVPWVNVWFRESAEQRSNAFETFYGPFNACASSPEIFEDAFGPDFRTRMIGQVVELEGEFQRYYCKGWKGSVRISLAHQIRKVDSLDPIKPQARQ
jgi:hypothetical protein